MTGRRNRRTGRRQRTGSSWHRRIADGREDRKKALRQVSAADYGKCRAENGKDKMVFPDERTARRAADALNALPGVRDMQEPYRCRRKGMDHFHLRQVCGKLGRRNRPPADGTAVAGEERE